MDDSSLTPHEALQLKYTLSISDHIVSENNNVKIAVNHTYQYKHKHINELQATATLM